MSPEQLERCRERGRARSKTFYRENRQKAISEQLSRYYSNYISYMLTRARARAKDKNLEFDLSEEDIIIPATCPVLGIELVMGDPTRQANPSLDRFDNNKGYTRDNIRVISNRANNLKGDASIEELEKIIMYMKSTK
jgi:hypothetical protein